MVLGFEKKEREIRTRVYLPTGNLKHFKELPAVLQNKTRDIMGKVFDKKYEDLTVDDLNEFTSGLCSRMMSFEGDFPNFMPHLVREIINHPNVHPIDRDHLESYSDLFEMKWRDNPEQPLWLSPIYMNDSRKDEGDLEREKVVEKLRKAGIPYLEPIKQKIIEASNQA